MVRCDMKQVVLAHLLPAARKQAELGNEERIYGLLRDRWIDYPRATQALQQLERLYETPRRERMPCLLMHGDSNIGKTKITAKFRRAHPNEFDDRSGVERCSVVGMQMPPTPDQHRFYSGLLFEFSRVSSFRPNFSAWNLPFVGVYPHLLESIQFVYLLLGVDIWWYDLHEPVDHIAFDQVLWKCGVLLVDSFDGQVDR
jgi:hypothetical protein